MGGHEIQVDCHDTAEHRRGYRRKDVQLVCQLREFETRVTHDELVDMYRKDAEAGGLSLRTCRSASHVDADSSAVSKLTF